MELTDANVKAMVIAHAILLGKSPPAGVMLSFNAEVEQLYTRTMDTRKLLGKTRYEFKVTEQDIANAERLIENERWTHAHAAKATILPLEQKGPPELTGEP
jgi:hypothetical protein